jgi:DNA modification methylase
MFEKKLVVDVADIPVDNQIKPGQLFNITTNNVSYLTHNIHKYPAKFIPHIPKWAMSKYLKDEGKLVLDPFCGSGTTLVEAILNSHNSVGIDIDPLAVLISKVKTTKIDPQKLIKIKKDVIKSIKMPPKHLFRPELETLEHWFNDEAINDLGLLRSIIEEYRDDKNIYDFLIVTFSSIIRKVSNADDQSQKTYVSHTNIKNPPSVLPLFIKRLDLYSNRLTELFEKVNKDKRVLVAKNDSRDLSLFWEKNNLNQADLAITSPPYIKAIDYIYNQMAEYFWIGDLFGLDTQKKQNIYKTEYIGTKQIGAKIYKGKLPKTGIDEIDALVLKIKEKDVKHAYIVAKFFVDMEKSFKEVKNVLKDNSHYILVIGNNSVSGYNIPSHKFLIECAEKIGFKYSNHFGYNIRNRYMRFPRKGRGGIIKEDWVIDFVKE